MKTVGFTNFKSKYYFVLVFFLLILVIGKFWYFSFLVVLSLFFLLVNRFLNLIKIVYLRKILQIIFKFFFLIIIVIGLNILVFEVFTIPSSSMRSTLLPNDIIVVNKLKYGPRLPRSPLEIPIISRAYYFNENVRKKIRDYWWPYKRLSGTDSIKKGDIVVFNSISKKNFFLVVA